MFKYQDRKTNLEVDLDEHDIYFLYLLLNFDGDPRGIGLATYNAEFQALKGRDFCTSFLKNLQSCPTQAEMEKTVEKLIEIGLITRRKGPRGEYSLTPETHFLLYWFKQKSETPDIKFETVINKFLYHDHNDRLLPEGHWEDLLSEGYLPEEYTQRQLHITETESGESKDAQDFVIEYLEENLAGKILIYEDEAKVKMGVGLKSDSNIKIK